MPNTLLNISMITRELLDCFENNLVMARRLSPNIVVNLPARLEDRSVADAPLAGPAPHHQWRGHGHRAGLRGTRRRAYHRPARTRRSPVQLLRDDACLSMTGARASASPRALCWPTWSMPLAVALYWQVPNAILPGTATDKWLAYLQAGAILADNGTPSDGEWCAVLNQWEQAAVINGNKALFESSPELRRQYERGLMGQSAGLTGPGIKTLPCTPQVPGRCAALRHDGDRRRVHHGHRLYGCCRPTAQKRRYLYVGRSGRPVAANCSPSTRCRVPPRASCASLP